jgi:hypothetical protein
MSSSPPNIDRSEQAEVAMHRYEPSTASTQEILASSAVSSATPTLPGQILTENDHEDDLMDLIDELIRNFLSRPTRRSPFRTSYKWTFDDEANLSYSVTVGIQSPTPFF